MSQDNSFIDAELNNKEIKFSNPLDKAKIIWHQSDSSIKEEYFNKGYTQGDEHKFAIAIAHPTYINYPMIVQGWQCPKCQKINSPTLMQCFCNAQQPYQQPQKPFCDLRIDDIIC